MSKKSWFEIIAAALTVAGAALKRKGDRDRDRDREDYEKSERGDRGKSRPKPRR